MYKESIKMAYIAGIMDGDGSFSIGKLKTVANPIYFPLLQFVNKRPSVVDTLTESFGGTRLVIKPSKDKKYVCNHNSYRWRIRSGKNVRPVLEKLLPYLKIKKDRAEFLLEFINSFSFEPGIKQSLDRIALKDRYYLKMISLNDYKSFNTTITSVLAKENTKDPIFWSYLAGLFDTDGSFSIKKQVSNKGTQVKNPRYLPVISLSMTDMRAINYIRSNCNLGRLYIPNNPSCSYGYHYQYGIYTKEGCVTFLRNIIPFLVGKKENAAQLLEFCEKSKKTLNCGAGVPAEELIFRESCYRSLVNLNKYGIVKPSLMDLELLPDNAGDNKAEGSNATVNVVSEKAPYKGDAEL